MLKLRNICFSYPTGTPIFKDWSGTFRAGEAHAVIGDSGSGKSTLLYLAALLLTPQEGHVSVAGIDTAGLSDGKRSLIRNRDIGFVFQDACLDPSRSVLDNVMEKPVYSMGSQPPRREEALQLLAELQVDVEATALPGQISGGQAQRIGLARALFGVPRIILADEPTGNLDLANADVVVNRLLTEADAGKCVVVASHDQRLIAACGRQIYV